MDLEVIVGPVDGRFFPSLSASRREVGVASMILTPVRILEVSVMSLLPRTEKA